MALTCSDSNARRTLIFQNAAGEGKAGMVVAKCCSVTSSLLRMFSWSHDNTTYLAMPCLLCIFVPFCCVQAALGHLLTLRHDQVVSFARCDDPEETVGAPVLWQQVQKWTVVAVVHGFHESTPHLGGPWENRAQNLPQHRKMDERAPRSGKHAKLIFSLKGCPSKTWQSVSAVVVGYIWHAFISHPNIGCVHLLYHHKSRVCMLWTSWHTWLAHRTHLHRLNPASIKLGSSWTLLSKQRGLSLNPVANTPTQTNFIHTPTVLN